VKNHCNHHCVKGPRHGCPGQTAWQSAAPAHPTLKQTRAEPRNLEFEVPGLDPHILWARGASRSPAATPCGR